MRGFRKPTKIEILHDQKSVIKTLLQIIEIQKSVIEHYESEAIQGV